MRRRFGYYYSDNKISEIDSDGLWSNGLFVVDSNVLLNIYGYRPTTRARWMDTLIQLRDNLWIPHQVALEYHRKFAKKVKEVNDESAKKFLTPFTSCKTALKEEHALGDREDANDLFQQLGSLIDSITKDAEKIAALWQRDFAQEWIDIREEIADVIVDEKIGPEYDTERLAKICAEGTVRYRQNIPPGYKDASKDEGNPYGDLIIWFQLMDKAKETKKNMVFITHDRKPDWVKNGTAREELVKEMYENCGVHFRIFDPLDFLSFADDILGRVSDPQAIKETKDAQTPAITRASLLGENSQPLMIPGMSLWPNVPYAVPYTNLPFPIPYANVSYPAMDGDYAPHNFKPIIDLVNKVPIYENNGVVIYDDNPVSEPKSQEVSGTISLGADGETKWNSKVKDQ